jgi:flagellar export protein FliJ
MADEDRYRAAPVRDQRARAERVKRGELAAAVGDAKETDTRVTAARAALAEALAARDAQPTAASRALADRFVARRRRELEGVLDAAARAAGAVDAARVTLVRARAEREIIERHFARWREERRKLADRRDD